MHPSRLSFFLLALFGLFIGACSSTKEQEAIKKSDILYAQGTSQLLNKNYTEALDSLLKAQELNPKNSQAQNNLGMAYYFKGDKALAEKHLKRAIDLDKKNSDAKNNLASLYFEQNKIQQAKEIYQTILKDLVYEHQYRVHYNLALISLMEGNVEEAKNALMASLKENSEYCPANFKLGELAERAQDYKAAYDYYFKAGDGQCYQVPAPHFKQALMLKTLGDGIKAEKKFLEVNERFKDTPYASLSLGELRKIKSQEIIQSREEIVPKQDYQSPQF